MRYRPLNLGRWLLWGATAIVFAVAPLVFTESFALTMMIQMGTMIIFALSYNMLLGQGGMLSFGHAVYSGLGAYMAVHALNLAGKGMIVLPVPLLPLVGGIAGLAFGVLFGYVTTRRAGTTFAMISLGVGEMVFACVLMFPGFFGGEAGVSTNRVVGQPFLGLSFGPAIQVYYLVAFWCLACMVAMFALTQTPLGRMANAVRDNPERAEFVGYNPQRVRFLMLALSGFFAGIAGGLGRKRSAEAIEAVRKMSEAAVKNLEQIKTSRDDNTFLDWGRRSKAGPVAGATAATLLRTLWNLDLDDLANSAAAAMLAKPGIFGPDTVLVPAFSILAEEEGAGFASQAAFLDLWKHAADFLLARSEFPPAAPTDWAQPVQFNCACALCKELRQFAADPKEQVHRFRVRQESRSHLQSIIQMNGLDMKHETERIGSPQTLVCTKTRRRYESRCNEYKSDGSQFEIMAQLGKGFADKVPVHLKRVQSAIDRAGGWRTGS